MKHVLTAIVCLLFSAVCFSQSRYMDSLKLVLQQTKVPKERFNLLEMMGRANFTTGDSNVDSLVCIELHQIAKDLNSDSLLAVSYNWIGDYFLFTKADNTVALEYFFLAVPIAKKANHQYILTSIYLDIALTFFNLNNPSTAFQYIQLAGKSLPHVSAAKYDYMARQYQSAMATYYVFTNNPDSALHFIHALNETNQRLKGLVFETRAFGLTAAVHDLKGDMQLAEIFYTKANILADSAKFLNLKLFVKRKFIDFLFRNNKLDKAETHAKELIALGDSFQNKQMKFVAAGYLRQIYEKSNNLERAYFFSAKESALQDSIFSQNNINKIQALTFNEQLRMIDETAATELAAEQKKRNIQYTVLALGIINFIIIYFLLSRSTITNQKLIEFLGVLSLLIVFEFLNLLLHPILDKLTGHSPILMLLAFVCLAALLVPLHHRVEKWMLKTVVEKNKKIRLAAAKRTIEQFASP
jgi:hypothetical protein